MLLTRLILLAALGGGLLHSDARAGAWTLPEGRLWAKVAYFQQATDEWYLSFPEPYFRDGQISEYAAGTRRPYRFDGEYESVAVFAEAFYGVTDRLDVGVQVPWFDQTLTDITRPEPPSDAGFGDVRLSAKLRLTEGPALVTLKTVAKLPTGDFINEDGLIPVSEGQWDFDFLVQVGRSFWPLPAYANVDAGYRLRLANGEVDRDPGDEWLLNAEVGVNLTRRLLVMVKLESLWGQSGVDQGIETSSLKKQIAYLAPTVFFTVRDGLSVEAALRYTLGGRNFPAGKQLTVGLSTEVDVPGMGRSSPVR